ncbi:porin [Variovorax sp. J22R115]|uniref:porin n=1 Tax=Variovorax sp. J22R115 TaxID=3053509 RepID=UPI002578C2D0|nr:porin [Variovorax sp. J22R115]MDM0052891.1 porin [Variovorax sp. J22R115]
MKKQTLIALAALTAAGMASAQSSVTLFGVVDAAVSGYKSQSETPLGTTITKSQTVLSSGGYNSSRLGFRGTEDLGGGIAASFWLEAGMTNDNGGGAATGGGLNFNRRSTVSLSGILGELRLGRDYVPTFWNDGVFDPFNTNGAGTSLIATASGGTALGVPNSGFQSNRNYVRASNSIGYFLPPSLGGFYGQFMYALNEKVSYDPGGLTPPGVPAIVANPALATVADDARAGCYIGGRFGYATGPLDVALAYGKSTIGSNFFLGSTTTLNIWNLGASYDFGPVKVFGEYSNNKQKTDLATNTFAPFGVTKPGANGGLVGVTIPVDAGLIRAAYSLVRYNNVHLNIAGLNPDPKSDQFALGYVYNLSRRTALYSTVAYVSNKDGAGLAVTGAPAFYTGTIPGGPGAAVPSKSIGYDVGIRHAF